MQLRYILIIIFVSVTSLYAQNFTEGFDVVDSIYTNGWERNNNSSPSGEDDWVQDYGNFNPPPSGGTNSSIVVSYKSIASGQAGEISNWLITPTIVCTTGDSIIFYTKSFQNTSYPDRMEVRLNKSNTNDVGSSSSDVGDFDTLLLVINPTLTAGNGGYPMSWKRYACAITGIPPGTAIRIGFRYWVTDGGSTGSNSSTVGIDNFEYKSVFTGIEEETPLIGYVSIQQNILLVEVPEAEEAFGLELLDISGKRISFSKHDKKAEIDLSGFTNGVYLVKITYKGKYLVKKISL